VLSKKDIDVSEYERLSNNTLGKKIKVKEQHFYCCSTFHSNSKVLNNEHNSYPKMSEAAPSLELRGAVY